MRPGSPGRSRADEHRRLVRAAWTAVLERDGIPDRENLFDAGGTSVHVARLREALMTAFSREISLVEIYRYPTIASFAEHLAAEPAPSAAGPAPGPAPDPSEELGSDS